MVVVTLLSRSIERSRCFKASLSARRSDPLQDGLHCVMDVDIETHKGSSIYLGSALSPYTFTRLTSRDETGKIPPRLVTIKEG